MVTHHEQSQLTDPDFFLVQAKLVHTLSDIRHYYDKLVGMLLHRGGHRVESSDVLAVLHFLRPEAQLGRRGVLSVQRLRGCD